MTDLNLAEIEALAKAAGGHAARWTAFQHNDAFGVGTPDRIVCDEKCPPNEPDCRHIARMDPATTLRLLNLITLKDVEIADLEAFIFKLRKQFDDRTGEHRDALAEKDAEIERLRADRDRWRDAADRLAGSSVVMFEEPMK